LTKDKVTDTLPKFYNSLKDICAILSNDLEPVTIGRFPVIREIKELLLEKGAAGVLMSGSGPTVFAVFETEVDARKCHAEIAGTSSWFSIVTHTI
jgi:4-diphosphocytidyl-2-C-methyl-D-erythritol kinase